MMHLLVSLLLASIGAQVQLPSSDVSLFNDPRTPRCDGSIFQKGENIPASTADRAHEMIHAASIREHGKIVAWLYRDRGGSLQFQAATDASVSFASIRSAMETFTDSTLAPSSDNYSWTREVRGAFHPENMAGHLFTVRGCY